MEPKRVLHEAQFPALRSSPTVSARIWYNSSQSMNTRPALIIGRWGTREVRINGKIITPAGFVADLKADEAEPGDNDDLLRECDGLRSFDWGDASQATYCLALACCSYLNLSWVMDRFFTPELQRLKQADFRLAYDEDTLQAAYEHCEDLFAQEFKDFMEKLGAVPVDQIAPVTPSKHRKN
jgi:hypothetical protein